MRLITFSYEGAERIGAWIDQDRSVVDLARAAERGGSGPPAYGSMQALIDAGPQAWDDARALVDAAPGRAIISMTDCRLLAPLPRPAQIRDCLTFPAHLEGSARAMAERMIRASAEPEATRAEIEASGRLQVPKVFYEFPLYYVANRMSVVGPDVDVSWPRHSHVIDYEMEWAAVVGKEARNTSAEDGRAHIFGYTIFNDWSARDEQMKVMKGAMNAGPAAAKDFCNGVGPCIVTADEIPDPYDLLMRVRVNGEQVSEGSTSGMYYKFEDLLAYLSRDLSLYPGELICSGTVGGGCTLETGITLKSGDIIELDVERIGVLRNRVVAPHMN